MEKYIVAIPSYKRADKQESAEYFSLLGIPKERIYIFVQTQEDEEAYQRYKDIATVVYRPAQAVAQARNNILKYFNGATNILMLDDDISCIGRLKAGKIAEITSREELSQTINRCFAFTAKSGAELFGLYPVYNAFLCRRTFQPP